LDKKKKKLTRKTRGKGTRKKTGELERAEIDSPGKTASRSSTNNSGEDQSGGKSRG
jgi:hypothetical protein